MPVQTFTDSFTSPVPAGKLFKASIVDIDNLIQKLIPNAVKNVEWIQGNGGPGSIKKINLPEGKYVKNRIDELDEAKLTFKYSAIEGVPLGDKLESIDYDLKYESSADGGCKATTVVKYHPKAGVVVKEEDVKADKEKAETVFKAVEAYLLANPQAYA